MTVTTCTGKVCMREKHIENQLVRAIKRIGGICPKFTSPGLDGVPDRLILLPGGHIAFAELKAPGKEPRPLQLVRKVQLERLGFKVFIIDDICQIGGVISAIQTP